VQEAELVPVRAVFEQAGEVIPLQIKRGQQWQRVKIVYAWTKRQGLDFVRYFNVSDGANLYTLSFNDRQCAWLMHTISPL
jgi:hypothetical protein